MASGALLGIPGTRDNKAVPDLKTLRSRLHGKAGQAKEKLVDLTHLLTNKGFQVTCPEAMSLPRSPSIGSVAGELTTVPTVSPSFP